MTYNDYLEYVDGYITNTEEKDGKWYIYMEGGYTDVYESDESGNFIATSYDENGECYRTLKGNVDGNYNVLSSDGIVVERNEVIAEGHTLCTKYFPGGKKIQSITECNGDEFSDIVYDESGKVLYERTNFTNENYSYDGSGNLILKIDGDTTTEYTYDSDNQLVRSREYNPITNIEITKRYSKSMNDEEALTEQKMVSDRLIYTKKYEGKKLISDTQYEYYENGRIKKITGQKEVEGLTNKSLYIYDEEGHMTMSSDYYKDGELFVHLTDNKSDYGVLSEGDGEYSFYVDGDIEFLHIDKEGNRTYRYSTYQYSFGIYDSSDDEYDLLLKPSGEYVFTSKDGNHTGTYSMDENGYIICIDQNNNTYEYNSFGQLVKKEINGIKYEYSEVLRSEKKIKDGKTTYSLINHIEYDEDAYEVIMKGMVNISDEYPALIENDYGSCIETINSFVDKYSAGEISNVRSEIQSIISTINDVKESINYSLLAYSACDRHLEEKTHSLIDSLFDESEKSLASVFKRDIAKSIEDRDNDKILEYKEDTNFDSIYRGLLPLDKTIDSDGNEWYYNLKGELVNVIGDNPKISYGGVEFKVEVTDNGVIKLIDSDGKPLNIYGDYNIESGQYGGDQSVFRYQQFDLLYDERILGIIDKYFDPSSSEEKSALLNVVAGMGCGHVGMTNLVFKEFEGKEEEFYEAFGFPMYTINKYGNNKHYVDYNYEPVILDLYCRFDNIDRSISNTSAHNYGSAKYYFYNMYNYLHNEYGVFDQDYNSYVENCGMFYDTNFRLYDLDGNPIAQNYGSHVMTKICELDDGRWIVSNCGKKEIYEAEHTEYITLSEEEMNELREWGLI